MDNTAVAVHQKTFDALHKRVNGGVSWFSWFIGLSILQIVLQTGLPIFGIQMPFSLGLGVTFILIPFLYELTGSLALTIVINAVPIVVLAIVARAARKSLVAYGLGIALMITDFGVYIAMPDWIGIGFHAVALVFFVRGFLALRDMQRLREPG